MNPNPPPDPKPAAPAPAPAPVPQPKAEVLLMCVHCGQGIETSLPTDHAAIELLLAQRGWFVAFLSPPPPPGKTPEKILFAPLCAPCAPTVFPPPALKAAEEHRKRLLQGAQVAK